MRRFSALAASSIYARRQGLREQLSGGKALLFSGGYVGRNYAGNPYGFRASSHFLYFVGRSLVDACYLSTPREDILFIEPQSDGDVLWHGHKPSLDALSDTLDLRVEPLSRLSEYVDDEVASIPAVHCQTRAFQERVLRRPISGFDAPQDQRLAEVIVGLRINHDAYGLKLIRETARLAAQAHARVPSYIEPGLSAQDVWARMQSQFTAHGFGVAYNPIITCRGEVLHGGVDSGVMRDGDLLLLDVGCEHPEGWASDISRTWPVSGALSSTQSLIHQAVQHAQDEAINGCKIGVEYADVHVTALRSLTQSLLDIGILKGGLDTLMEREVGAFFFPHGVGHLLGLDVHDMEDLGDIAGYSKGRKRSDRRSLRYLRMNRVLQENMVVTIEPGFYQIPQLLDEARRTCSDLIDWGVLDQFADVRGVRIEDDVLIEKSQSVVLSTGDAVESN